MDSPPSPRPLVWDQGTVDETQAAALASDLGIDPVIARLLVLRGFAEPEAAERFLHPTIDHLHDPFQLTDLPKAVDRLLHAIECGERIAVHGDYDVDGVTSTVILRRLLELLGAEVIHFIPDRLKDGYGLEPAAIDRLAAQQVSVVV
ncbi:MAG: hypothetical protein QGI10_01750, partial [Vicinamibacterales bacterium]|nr:hypothetical protein [Vicinamibacterales bacterium]